MVHGIIERFPRADVTYCAPGDRDRIGRDFAKAPRRAVFLKHHKGAFLKPFPRHPWYDKGGGVYHNLILGYNCYGSCHYCFIQTIFEDAIPTMYVNSDDMTRELRAFLENDPRAWISTGEYIDSLQLDETTHYTETVMDVMRDFPEAVLELRTKSGKVDHLPDIERPFVTVAFSISPQEVVADVEPGTASLERRLDKARLLHAKGYRIAVRIDPIIATKKYLHAYGGLASIIEERLSWHRVSEVFLGILRFDDALLKRMAASTAARRLLDAEYVPCPDGKYRPLKQARIEAYRDMVQSIRAYHPDIDITIMMEPDYVLDPVFKEDTVEAYSARSAPHRQGD